MLYNHWIIEITECNYNGNWLVVCPEKILDEFSMHHFSNDLGKQQLKNKNITKYANFTNTGAWVMEMDSFDGRDDGEYNSVNVVEISKILR